MEARAAAVIALLALAACGVDSGALCGLEIQLDEPVADECAGVCGTVIGPKNQDVVVRSTLDGASAGVHIERDGEGRFCLEGQLTPGIHALTTSASSATCDAESASLDVRPFGYAVGLDKPVEVLESPPWIPEITGLGDPPVLKPEPGSWDASVVSMPSWITADGRELLYYSGRADDTEYALGVAERQPDGSFQRLMDQPLLIDQLDDWNALARNTPEIIYRDGSFWLFYNGEGINQWLSIEAATSSDGAHFTQYADNPILTAEDLGPIEDKGNSVAHTSLVERDGVWELWFATGTLWLGYALSTDGEHFEPYCGNPVFEGLNTWDQGDVKAPEVVFEDDLYWMTFSGCERGCYQVGWAASADGLRWAAHPDPILPAQGGTGWNSVATQGAEIRVDGDTWSFWYAGSDGVHTAIGLGQAVKE